MIEIRKLKCGVRVAMEYIDEVQSVSLGIWVHAGSGFEGKSNSGVSHFIEHMMFKGTGKRSAMEISRDMDAMGSRMNAFTGKEATCYYFKSLSSNAEKSLDILLDMFTDSQFDEEEMERERRVIYEEMKMSNDDPADCCIETIMKNVFRGTPLSSPVLGTESSLGKTGRRTILNYIKKQYTCDSIVVSVAGNFDKDAICEKLETAFGIFAEEKPAYGYEPGPYEPSFRVKVKDIEQSHIALAVKSLPVYDDDYFKVAVFSEILGGSMSSRLFQNIRERKGLAYTVYSSNASFENDGIFYIYAAVAHDRIGAAVRGVREELEELGSSDVGQDELSKAKEQLKSGFIFGLENVNSMMFRNGREVLRRGSVIPQEEILEGVDAVTAGDVSRIAEKLCDMDSYSAAAVTNRRVELRRMVKR
ncbi:MAG: M16 family metallopeptidase [Anaerovoracaceae bacterium]|jgi:predicted Zn-dependent peptidase